MSVPKLLDLINNCIKDNSLSKDDYSFILSKAREWNIQHALLQELIKAKNINITESQTNVNTGDVLNRINSDIQVKIKEWFNKQDYRFIITFYDDKLYGTLDNTLIKYYLKSLILELEYKKALDYVRVLKDRNQNFDIELKKIISDVYIRNENYETAFLLNYELYENGDAASIQELESIAALILEKRKFDAIHLCNRLPNYIVLFKKYLFDYYNQKDYKSYIWLFESYFTNDLEMAKNYIWSLYRTDGEERKAYDAGINYIQRIPDPSVLYLVMGYICSYINKYKEAYDYFLKCQNIGIEVQEHIDKIIEKIIKIKEWEILSQFKNSNNYLKLLNEGIHNYFSEQKYEIVVLIFERFINTDANENTIKIYIKSLKENDVKKALNKYKEYYELIENKDTDWFLLGANLNESNFNYQGALDKFILANNEAPGCYENDIKRITYILNPDIHLKELFEQQKYSDAIEIFESKLLKTTDISVIKFYIKSLFQNNNTEEKALEKAILYSKSHADGNELYKLIYSISKHQNKYNLAKEFILKAQTAGQDVAVELQEINFLIAEVEEKERKQKEELAKKQKEEELKKQTELENIKRQAFEAEKAEIIKSSREKIDKIKNTSKESESDLGKDNATDDDENSNSSNENDTHHFKSSVTCGGDPILPEHIYIDKNEVRWEKKSGLFSKDSKSIQLKDITQIDLSTSMVCGSIVIRSSSSGSIHGEHFSKSNVKEIKEIIESLK